MKTPWIEMILSLSIVENRFGHSLQSNKSFLLKTNKKTDHKLYKIRYFWDFILKKEFNSKASDRKNLVDWCNCSSQPVQPSTFQF